MEYFKNQENYDIYAESVGLESYHEMMCNEKGTSEIEIIHSAQCVAGCDSGSEDCTGPFVGKLVLTNGTTINFPACEAGDDGGYKVGDTVSYEDDWVISPEEGERAISGCPDHYFPDHSSICPTCGYGY